MTDKLRHFHLKKKRKAQIMGISASLAFVLTVSLSIFTSHQSPAAQKESAMFRESDRCTRYFSATESKYNMPENLLRAISTVESGRWNRITLTPITWPWTLNVDGRGYHYKSKDEAVLAVRTFQHNGARFIDVGCMQINLQFHPEAFHNLAKALEPRYNIEYAAQLLKRHYRLTRDWRRAIARYHSATPHRGERYANKVMQAWDKINRELAQSQENAPIPTAKVSMNEQPRSDVDG